MEWKQKKKVKNEKENIPVPSLLIRKEQKIKYKIKMNEGNIKTNKIEEAVTEHGTSGII